MPFAFFSSLFAFFECKYDFGIHIHKTTEKSLGPIDLPLPGVAGGVERLSLLVVNNLAGPTFCIVSWLHPYHVPMFEQGVCYFFFFNLD